MEAPEPDIEPETPPLATLKSLDDHSLDEVTRKINVTDHYRLGVALGRRGIMQDALTRLGSKPYRTLGAVMSAASKFRGSLKEKYTVDLTEGGNSGGTPTWRGAGILDRSRVPFVKEMLDSGGWDGHTQVGRAGLTVTRWRVKDPSSGHIRQKGQFQVLFNDYERGRSKTVEDNPYNFFQYNERYKGSLDPRVEVERLEQPHNPAVVHTKESIKITIFQCRHSPHHRLKTLTPLTDILG